jgi:hypothetical protein
MAHFRAAACCCRPCAALLLGGCLFEARDPEPPTSLAIDYLPRSSAENIWENCRLALINRDTGGWDTAVSENFVYVPDSDTEQAYPAVDWANWDKDREMDFINSWFASGVTIQADLRDTDISTPPGDGGVAEWEIIYLLTVDRSADRLDHPLPGFGGAGVHPRGQLLLPELLAGRAGRGGPRHRRPPGDHGPAAGSFRILTRPGRAWFFHWPR